MSAALTPPEVAARWRCKPETVRRLLACGALRGYSLSPPGTRRPRWRVTLDAVLAYEAGERADPATLTPRRTHRRRAECPAGPF